MRPRSSLPKRKLPAHKHRLEGAQVTLERYRKIEGTGISAANVKDAEVSLHKAEASLKTVEAALRTARLNLQWTGDPQSDLGHP